MWPLSRDNHGYALCGFHGRVYKAAALMCQLVHGPRPTPKHHAAHSCGNGQEGCVHPKHVRWATPKENMADSVRLGAVRQPGQRPTEILTEETVAQIMAMKGKAPYSVIGRKDASFGSNGAWVVRSVGAALNDGRWPWGPKNPNWFECRRINRRTASRLHRRIMKKLAQPFRRQPRRRRSASGKNEVTRR